jgi:hypothetical protein
LFSKVICVTAVIHLLTGCFLFMRFVKPFFFLLLSVGLVFYWTQTGNVSQQIESNTAQGSIAGGASSSQVEQENKITTRAQVNPAETTLVVTDFTEQTSVIEQTKTITLLAEQSLTIWPQGCNLVVLEKNNRKHVNDGETLILEANSADKRIIHLVEKGHFTYAKNTTRFSKKEQVGSVTEQELEARLSGVKKTGSSSCSSRYQISQA